MARVQDPGSAAPVAATAHLQPKLIIDFCAGRGTKTRQLAALHPQARIIATDVDDARRKALRLATEGLPQVEVVAPDKLLPQFAGAADLLLLDVPCSNTGVLARRVEAKHRFNDSALQSLVATQRQIVADSMATLAENGCVLYATCSLQRRENHDHAAWIAQWHRMTLDRTDLRLPRGLPGQAANRYADGSFFALLSKAD